MLYKIKEHRQQTDSTYWEMDKLYNTCTNNSNERADQSIKFQDSPQKTNTAL